MSRRRAKGQKLHRVADICQAMPGKLVASEGQVQRIAVKLADTGRLTSVEWDLWNRNKDRAKAKPEKVVRVRMPAKRKQNENRFLEMKRVEPWHGAVQE